MTDFKIEEALESIWTLEEKFGMVERKSINEQLEIEPVNNLLEELKRGGLVNLDGQTIKLTVAGKKKAKLIIRRHRLAERLLHDVLDTQSDVYESSACQFEHLVEDDIVSSICTLLGHPDTCPHGKAIPKGDCCRKTRKDIKSLIAPLSELRSGDVGKVVYNTIKDQDRLDIISRIGILHGIELKVHQKAPTFVLQIGESQIDLGKDIVSNIYVRCKHR